MIRLILPLILFIIVVIFLAIGLFRDPRLVPSPLIDKPLPEFTLPTLADPEKLVSSQELIGHWFLLNIWASWCAPCIQEHPFLMKLSKQDIPIYGINQKDKRENALAMIARYGNPFVATLQDLDGRVSIDLGVYGAPETFIVNRDGKIIYKHIGVLNDAVWDKQMKPIIEQLPQAGSDNVK